MFVHPEHGHINIQCRKDFFNFFLNLLFCLFVSFEKDFFLLLISNQIWKACKELSYLTLFRKQLGMLKSYSLRHVSILLNLDKARLYKTTGILKRLCDLRLKQDYFYDAELTGIQLLYTDKTEGLSVALETVLKSAWLPVPLETGV